MKLVSEYSMIFLLNCSLVSLFFGIFTSYLFFFLKYKEFFQNFFKNEYSNNLAKLLIISSIGISYLFFLLFFYAYFNLYNVGTNFLLIIQARFSPCVHVSPLSLINFDFCLDTNPYYICIYNNQSKFFYYKF